MRDTNLTANVHLNRCEAVVKYLGNDPDQPYIVIDLGPQGAIFVNEPAYDTMREVVRLIDVLEARDEV